MKEFNVRRFFLPFVLVSALAGIVVAPAASAAPATTSDLTTVTVTGDVGTKPTIAITKPIAVTKTKTATVLKGSGDKAAKGDNVSVDFVFVNGRTGAELETSYGTKAQTITLDTTKTKPVVVKGLLGQRVGSRVVIAIAPSEGIAKEAAASTPTVKKSDTILFVADIHSAQAPVKPLKRAEGTAVAPVDGLPTVTLAKNGAPTITVPKTDAPTTLVVQPLITGSGPAVQAGQTITVHYTGEIWSTGKTFDASWKRGETASFPIGQGSVIQGWDTGLVGQTVGSQVLLVIPPDQAYGTTGSQDGSIKGTDTLVFVVDILGAS
ncbi:MAG: FKBP-type peptidyl-prolyl cis-trans isomerase [Acidimicrobiia bacterium]